MNVVNVCVEGFNTGELGGTVRALVSWHFRIAERLKKIVSF